MPIGYLVTVLLVAVCTAVALVPPRPRHSRPFSVAFWFGFLVNEIPVLAIEFLVLATLLASPKGISPLPAASSGPPSPRSRSSASSA